MFDDDEDEEEGGSQNLTAQLNSQAKVEGSLPPAECCVSTRKLLNLQALVQCVP